MGNQSLGFWEFSTNLCQYSMQITEKKVKISKFLILSPSFTFEMCFGLSAFFAKISFYSKLNIFGEKL